MKLTDNWMGLKREQQIEEVSKGINADLRDFGVEVDQ